MTASTFLYLAECTGIDRDWVVFIKQGKSRYNTCSAQSYMYNLHSGLYMKTSEKRACEPGV